MQSPFEGLDVSRETMERLKGYHDLVLKWTPKINLISKSSIGDLWNRHIWDSAQVMLHDPNGRNWLDIGSGGGFPGLVVAIISLQTEPDRQVHMVESDQRKCAFLRAVIRELGLNAKVTAQRIESTRSEQADVLSARALADLTQLLEFAHHHLAPSGSALFMKGATWEKEVQDASESWSFDLKAHKSVMSPGAAILEIKEIERV